LCRSDKGVDFHNNILDVPKYTDEIYNIRQVKRIRFGFITVLVRNALNVLRENTIRRRTFRLVSSVIGVLGQPPAYIDALLDEYP